MDDMDPKDMDLKTVAETLKDIDFVMPNTLTDGGQIASRPMSNNRDVDYGRRQLVLRGRGAAHLRRRQPRSQRHPGGAGAKGLLGKPPLFLAIEGEVEIIRDAAAKAEHRVGTWTAGGLRAPSLRAWPC